jgi:hypothetical protein
LTKCLKIKDRISSKKYIGDIMRCPHCNEKLAPHDLWCVKCGKQTHLINNDLSALKSLNSTWKKYKPVQGNNFPVGILAVLTGVIPMVAIFWLLNYIFAQIPTWQIMLTRNFVWLFFLPVLMVPISATCKKEGYQISIGEYFGSFKNYGHYLILSLFSVLFYLVIYFVCKGDPILNLVWLVLVVYWIAVVFPVPVLMERYNMPAWQALILAYKKAGDLRWNILLLEIILIVANAVAGLLLVIGLAVILPFSWFAIRDYVDKMIEYEVFDTKAS